MALKKTITNPKGITTEYHKVKDITVKKAPSDTKDAETNYIVIAAVSSYVSEDIRDSSENLIADTKNHIFKCKAEELEQQLFELVYNRLKKMPVFEGAEDC